MLSKISELYLRLSFCNVPRMFSLVRDVFGSFVRADSKAWTKDEFCDKYERPIKEKSKQFGSKKKLMVNVSYS